MTVETLSATLQQVEPAYRNSLRLHALMLWAVPLAGSLIADRQLLAGTSFSGLLPATLLVMALFAIVIRPNRIYRRLGYTLDGKLLRVVRGWLFHTDTVVPFVRVQHIDVAYGPVDNLFGLARLVVHTAGTHNSIVTLPGLSPETAARIRDAIRAEIRADAE